MNNIRYGVNLIRKNDLAIIWIGTASVGNWYDGPRNGDFNTADINRAHEYMNAMTERNIDRYPDVRYRYEVKEYNQ